MSGNLGAGMTTNNRRIMQRMRRIICGRRLPQTWNTVLVLLSIHMYLTVPVILAAGINDDRTGLLRPFREIQQRGILLGEIDDDLLDRFYERCHAERMTF